MQINYDIYDSKNIVLNELDRTVQIPFYPSTIENIDRSVQNYVDKELNLFCTTNKGFSKVPVRWVQPERAFLSKEEPRKEGIFELPVISIQRSSIEKSKVFKGAIQANVPPDHSGTSIQIGSKLVQAVTQKFANATSLKRTNNRFQDSKFKNKRVVFEFFDIPQVVSLICKYSVIITTNYQQQMNELVTPFITSPGNINYKKISYNHHGYELFVGDNFSQKDSISSLENNERLYETTIDFRVLGYLFGEDKNEDERFIKAKQNIVDIIVSFRT